jgi:hypothetical protein
MSVMTSYIHRKFSKRCTKAARLICLFNRISRPAESSNNNAREPEAHTAQGSTDTDRMREESSSSSSDDDYASDHSNNGDWGLLDDSSPFALTQSFFQDTQK